MSWFRVDSDMADHPKTRALAQRLPGVDPVGLVVRVWSWTSRFCRTGHVVTGHVTPFATSIATSIGWDGDPSVLVTALCDTGWMDRDAEGSLDVHDWAEKQQKVASKAEKDRERQRVHRSKKKAALLQSVMRDTCDSHDATCHAVTPQRDVTLRDETRRDEEQQHHVELESSTESSQVFELKSDQTPTPPEPKRAPSEALEAGLTAAEREVFDHWRQTCGHPRAKLDPKRRKLLRERLRDYSAADLKAAVDGCSRSPHHQGQNDRQTRYDDLELILRDAKHVEQFIALAGNGNGCDF